MRRMRESASKRMEKDGMREKALRGIAAVDVGYTNTKIALFSPAGELVAERKAASLHKPAPPYRHIDPEPMVALCRTALPELDRMLPIDAIVPTAHGAAMALLDAGGHLAMPVMDYVSEPPPGIVADYEKIMPGFDEALCPLLPMALTHGLQVYWQQRGWPEDFARVRTLLPWIQYVGFRLSGVPVTEPSLGLLISNGYSHMMTGKYWVSFYPGIALLVTIVAINLVGDRLRDVLNPRALK